MGKPKLSEEQYALEAELRSMILSNVRITSDESSRGSQNYRGRGGFHQQQNHSNSNPPSPARLGPAALGSPLPTGSVHNRPQGYNRGGFAENRQNQQHGRHSNQVHNSGAARGRGHPMNLASRQVLQRPDAFGASRSNPSSPINPSQRQHGPPNPPPMAAFIAQCEYLDRVGAVEVPPLEIEPEEFAAKESLRARLELICQNAMKVAYPDLHSVLRLQCYGSLVSGFATQGSDVDMTIRWEGSIPEDSQLQAELPRVLEEAILGAGCGARLLSRTRVPIIKICESPTKDLLNALRVERQKWDSLPDDKKYPELTPLSVVRKIEVETVNERDHPVNHHTESQQIDPDVSRSVKSMDSFTTGPQPGTIAFLESIKVSTRSNDEDVQKYFHQFTGSANNLLRRGVVDNFTACTLFLEGLSPAVRAEAIARSKIDSEIPDSYDFADLSSIVSTIIAGRVKSTNLPKVWVRERVLGPLDFPKSGVGIQCDINFSNPLGIHNTHLLRCYSRCDPRVRPMILFVKAWAKRRKINSAYSGTLSSYGYVLMVLHYLVNVARPPVVPNLQHAFGAAQREVLVNGYNVSFWNDEHHIQQMAAQHQITQNTEPIGALLRSFFHYYAAQGPNVIGGGFNWMKDVLALRTTEGLLSKVSKGWTGAKTTTVEGREVRQRYLFCIEDPFEVDHNVARPVTHNGIVAIRDEFRRAWRILVDVGLFKTPEGELFEPIQDAPSPAKVNDTTQSTSAQNAEANASVNDDGGKYRGPDTLLPGLADLNLGGRGPPGLAQSTSNLKALEKTSLSPPTSDNI